MTLQSAFSLLLKAPPPVVEVPTYCLQMKPSIIATKLGFGPLFSHRHHRLWLHHHCNHHHQHCQHRQRHNKNVGRDETFDNFWHYFLYFVLFDWLIIQIHQNGSKYANCCHLTGPYKRGSDSGSQIIGSAKKAGLCKSGSGSGNKSEQIAGRWICFTAALKNHPHPSLPQPHPRPHFYFSHLYKLLWMVAARLIPYGAAWSTQSVLHGAVLQ